MKKYLFIIIILLLFLYLYFNIELIKKVSFFDDIIYLYVGEESDIDYDIDYNYYKFDNNYFESEDENIVKINGKSVIGNKLGETYIKFKYENVVYDKTKVIVTNLYNKYEINNNKDKLECNIYTKEENVLLDNILKYKINKAGYKTRAGVVEVARFLTLSFPYKIDYFYENGRLNNHNGDRKYVDGEGRYYHIGLYLNKSKYDSILSSYKKSAIWGCDLYSFIVNTTTPNGLDCSGFVTWALLNGGFDIGDVGAGNTKYDDDLSDLGEKIDVNSINKTIKVGDLIWKDGHIGMIIGINNNNYYIAESLNTDLHVLIVEKNNLKTSWTYIINMDNVYLKDGNINDMW